MTWACENKQQNMGLATEQGNGITVNTKGDVTLWNRMAQYVLEYIKSSWKILLEIEMEILEGDRWE
jgi:hypothetical protein